MVQNEPCQWHTGTKWVMSVTHWYKMSHVSDTLVQNEPCQWHTGTKGAMSVTHWYKMSHVSDTLQTRGPHPAHHPGVKGSAHYKSASDERWETVQTFTVQFYMSSQEQFSNLHLRHTPKLWLEPYTKFKCHKWLVIQAKWDKALQWITKGRDRKIHMNKNANSNR